MDYNRQYLPLVVVVGVYLGAIKLDGCTSTVV